MSVLLHSLVRIIRGLGRTHSVWLVQLFLESLLPGKSLRLRVYWRAHRAEDQSARAEARERSSVKRAALTDAPPQKPFLGKRFPVLVFPKAAEHSMFVELVRRSDVCFYRWPAKRVHSECAPVCRHYTILGCRLGLSLCNSASLNRERILINPPGILQFRTNSWCSCVCKGKDFFLKIVTYNITGYSLIFPNLLEGTKKVIY